MIEKCYSFRIASQLRLKKKDALSECTVSSEKIAVKRAFDS